MNKTERKEILTAFEAIYKSGMREIYTRFGNDVNAAAELRMMYLQYVSSHVLSKTQEELKRKINPTRKLNKLIKIMEQEHHDKEQADGIECMKALYGPDVVLVRSPQKPTEPVKEPEPDDLFAEFGGENTLK